MPQRHLWGLEVYVWLDIRLQMKPRVLTQQRVLYGGLGGTIEEPVKDD